MKKEEKELLEEVLDDLIYLNLEYDAKKDKLSIEGVATLVEIRNKKKYSLDNRLERMEKLENLIKRLQEEQ